MSKIHLTELVLRDGHQSLIATRLRTEDMLPICSKLDAFCDKFEEKSCPPPFQDNIKELR